MNSSQFGFVNYCFGVRDPKNVIVLRRITIRERFSHKVRIELGVTRHPVSAPLEPRADLS